MSKIVARTQKMKSENLIGIGNHNQRKTQNHSNEDIDTSLSYLNYDLVNRTQYYKTDIEKFINENKSTKRAIRKDAVLVNEWIITSDKKFFKNLFEDEIKNFFISAKDYFAEKFGDKNIRYATVHLDETTPHMHMGIVPFDKDNKLSAKRVFNRAALFDIQENLPKYLQEKGFDIERGLVNSDRKHLTVPEYKAVMEEVENLTELKEKFHREYPKLLAEKQKELDKIVLEITNAYKELDQLVPQKENLQEEIRKLTQERNNLIDRLMEYNNKYNQYSELQNRLFKAQNELKHINNSLIPLKAEYEARKAFISKANLDSDVSMLMPSYAEVIEKGLFKKEKFVQVPIDKWRAKHISANQISAIEQQHKEFERQIRYFKDLPEEVKQLKNENMELKKNVRVAHQELDELENRINIVFKKNPKLAEEFFETEKYLEKISEKILEMEYENDFDLEL